MRNLMLLVGVFAAGVFAGPHLGVVQAQAGPHRSRDAAKASWAAFNDDHEWKKVAGESQLNGPIVTKVDSVFLEATDYSPMK